MNPYQELHTILEELAVVVEKEEVPVFHYPEEQNPYDFSFTWNVAKTNTQKPVSQQLLRQTTLQADEVNFTCRRCPQKLSGIRNFIHHGKVPILILHYTGEYRPNKPIFAKRFRGQIFRTRESEDLFNRMTEKVFGLDYKSFYFQEYPACTFSHEHSVPEDWQKRLLQCNLHVQNTIQQYGIKGIFLLGASAVFYYGRQHAQQMLDNSTTFDFSGLQVPGVVLRSPEAILQLEHKKKQFAEKPDSAEYQKFKEEERRVKKNIVAQLSRFQDEIGL
ncbi:MAG: hypothetical protein AAF518_02785 [Spirochaetota bacterium]